MESRKLIAFGKSTSSKLKEAADEFIDIEEAIQKYLIKIRR